MMNLFKILSKNSKMPSSWVSSSSIFTFILIAPILFILANAFQAQSDTLIHLRETVLTSYIINTLILIFFVGILTFILGVGSAYFVVFYDFKFRKFFSISLVLPFLIPSYILGFIYSDVLGFYGPFHLFLMELGITSYFDVLHINTVIVLLSLALYPYVFLIVKASFQENSQVLINPALSLKANNFKIFKKVILPLTRPAIVASLSLVMMETISEYGLVSYYGVDVLSTAVFNAWFGLNDPQSAAFISSIAMFIVFFILIIEKLTRKNAQYKIETSTNKVEKQKLGFLSQCLIVVFLSIPFLFGFFIPLLWILIYSFENLALFLDLEFLTVIKNSFLIAFLSASCIIFLAILLAYSQRVFPTLYMKYLLKVATLGYSIPGAVIAIGILILASYLDNLFIDNFAITSLIFGGSLGILVFGYAVRFLSVGLGSVQSSFEKVGININKASQSLNKSLLYTLWKIDLPLIKNGLIAGFILVFIDVLKELPLTLILRPFNYETIASKTYELASIEMVQESSIYALTLIILSIVPIIFTLRKNK